MVENKLFQCWPQINGMTMMMMVDMEGIEQKDI